MDSKYKTKILVIGKDKKLYNILSNILNKDLFFIKPAKNGILSMKEVLSNKYQIIIINIHNRKETKILVKSFNNTEYKFPKTPIILISNKITTDEEIEIYKAGINIIHQKPVNPKLLLVQIDKILNENYMGIEIQMGDILLKPRQRKIFRGNTEINLTRTEYDFLLLLIKNNGGVLNRNQIIDRVFKYTRDVNHCAVDTMVSRIRKKLDRRKEEVIETVPGVGYRLSSKYTDNNKDFCYK